MVAPAAPACSEVEPCVELQIEACCKLEDEDVVTIAVKWNYEGERDENFDLRAWDFLALHKADVPADEYDASRYMLSNANGEIEFMSPSEPGLYAVSAVRDQKLILKAMKTERRAAWQPRVNTKAMEDLVSIGTAKFEVPSREREFKARTIPAGATGLKWSS